MLKASSQHPNQNPTDYDAVQLEIATDLTLVVPEVHQTHDLLLTTINIETVTMVTLLNQQPMWDTFVASPLLERKETR